MIAFPLRIAVRRDVWVEGAPCLNPRNAANAVQIRQFAHHERIHLWFLSHDLSDFVITEMGWPVAQHRHVAQLLIEIDQTLLGEELPSPFDPDFEAAKREFPSRSTGEHLLYRLQSCAALRGMEKE